MKTPSWVWWTLAVLLVLLVLASVGGVVWLAARDYYAAEVERLRARTHEIAAAKDAEHRAVKRDYGRLQAAVDQARERTRDWKADWAHPRYPDAPFQWWRHTSHNHAMEAVALIAERNDAQDRIRLLKEALRLARSIALCGETVSPTAANLFAEALSTSVGSSDATSTYETGLGQTDVTASEAAEPSGLERLAAERGRSMGEVLDDARRVEASMRANSDAGKVDRHTIEAGPSDPGAILTDALSDLSDEALVALNDLIYPLEDLPESDRLMRLISVAKRTKQFGGATGGGSSVEAEHNA